MESATGIPLLTAAKMVCLPSSHGACAAVRIKNWLPLVSGPEFAMATAPAIVTFVGGTPKDALNATLEMYEITFAESKFFSMPALDFRGTPTGIDIRKVVEVGITPRINTGIAHKNAGVGQVGAGLVRPPLKIFEDALVAFAERYNL